MLACHPVQPGETAGSSLAAQDGNAGGRLRTDRRPVRIVQECTAELFRREVVKAREPALLRGLPLMLFMKVYVTFHKDQKQ